MKTWWISLLMGAVFTAIGVAMVIVAWRVDAWGAWFAAVVFSGVGLFLLAATSRVRAEQSRGDLIDAQALSASLTSPMPGAWSFARIGAEISTRFAGTPYIVDDGPERIRIHADLADARFLAFAGARHVRRVRGLDVVLTTPGTAIRRDWSRGMEITAGLASFTAHAEMLSGTELRLQRRIEVGADSGGVRPAVDYRFDTRELNDPVKQVLEEAGWWRGWFASMSAEGKTAMVMAVIGASAIPLVPLAFLITWLTQR